MSTLPSWDKLKKANELKQVCQWIGIYMKAKIHSQILLDRPGFCHRKQYCDILWCCLGGVGGGGIAIYILQYYWKTARALKLACVYFCAFAFCVCVLTRVVKLLLYAYYYCYYYYLIYLNSLLLLLLRHIFKRPITITITVTGNVCGANYYYYYYYSKH